MAASDRNPSVDEPAPAGPRWLPASVLRERVEQEISRSERHGTELSCMLLAVENLDELAGDYDGVLREQALEYLAATLQRELRRFDTVVRPGERELLIVLPGADAQRAEIVARRTLERLRTIKVEVDDTRTAMRVSIGLAGWRDGLAAGDLIETARTAARAGVEQGSGEAPESHSR